MNATTQTAADTREFETVTCSRCAGSGNYSYCQTYGTTCFKCHGKGKVHTVRGKAAIDYFNSLNPTVRMDEIKVGQRVHISSIGKFTVRTSAALAPGSATSKGPSGETIDHPYWEIRGETLGFSASISHQVKLVLAPAVHNANRSAALDYQDTLTKAGTPRKRG